MDKQPTTKWSTINHKTWREWNGRLCHDGDCTIWSIDICTCGLLHHLIWFADQDFGEEISIESAKHQIQLDRVPDPEPYVKPTEEEVKRRLELVEKMFKEFSKKSTTQPMV